MLTPPLQLVSQFFEKEPIRYNQNAADIFKYSAGLKYNLIAGGQQVAYVWHPNCNLQYFFSAKIALQIARTNCLVWYDLYCLIIQTVAITFCACLSSLSVVKIGRVSILVIQWNKQNNTSTLGDMEFIFSCSIASVTRGYATCRRSNWTLEDNIIPHVKWIV